MAIKKSFTLAFKEEFFQTENLVLKAASLDGTYLRNQVTVEYLRSMLVPSARGSFATLTVNGVFWGLYWMKEEIDQQFVHSRIGNDKGNFYAMSKYLNYLGDSEDDYKNCTDSKFGVDCYNEKFGDGNWSDLIDFAKFLNQSSNEEFQSNIEGMLNVDNFIRTMVVLSAIDDPDSFTRNGNNWVLYHDTKAKIWQFLSKDFEDSMLDPLGSATDAVARNQQAVLAYRLFQIPVYQEQFKSYYVEFLKNCFSPKLQHATVSRISAFESFLLPMIQIDEFFHITYGIPVTGGVWKIAVKELQVFLETRYLILQRQFT